MVASPCGLDVLLIHLESFYNLETYQVNLGVLSIAASLQKSGLSVRVMTTLDVYYLTDEQLQQIIGGLNPRLVGFYTMTDTINQVAHFATKVRSWCPHCRTLAGGPLASGMKAEILQHYKFDYVIAGEGELSTSALAQYLRDGDQDPATIPGMCVCDGRPLTPPTPTQPITDLDALPYPARDLVPSALRLNISAGRGCPNACTYCFQAVHGKGYRFRSAENLAREVIGNLETGKYRAFDIIDDTFIADPERALRFCEIMCTYRQKSQRDFAWYCEARVDTFAEHPELLPALKAAGLVRLQVGIESGDEKTLQRYGKRLSLPALQRLCQTIDTLDGLSIFGNFIIGGPYETPETIDKSLQLAKKLVSLAPGLFECTSSFLTPFPETPINAYPERFGLRILDREFLTGVSLNECCCETQVLKAPQLRRSRFEFTTAVHEAMVGALPNISRKRILQHYHWQNKYGVVTRWLSQVFQSFPAVSEYFKFYDCPRFAAFSEVPCEQRGKWTPMRTIGTIQFNHDDWESYLLGASYAPISLREPLEKQIYALASGKLTLDELTDYLIERGFWTGERETLVRDHVWPLLEKLDNHYELIMHQ